MKVRKLTRCVSRSSSDGLLCYLIDEQDNKTVNLETNQVSVLVEG